MWEDEAVALHEVSDESHVRRGKPPLRRDASEPHDGGSGQRVATERMKRGALDVAARIGGKLEENGAIPAALALQVIGARSGGRAPEGLDEPGREALLEYTNSTSSASSCD